MIKMTRREFKENLVEALDDKDQYVCDEDIEIFLDLNYDEDSSIAEWTYSDFKLFVSDVCAEQDFWEAARLNDFHTPAEDEEEN